MVLPTPRKIATYPIASEPDAGALYLFGDPSSQNLVLLCAGYPDDHDNFLPFASRLAEETSCLVGVACLPGYDDREDFPYTKHKTEGYTFDEMANALREAAKTLRKESTRGGAKMIGIFHDWGVVPGLMYSNRSIEDGSDDVSPDRLVLFDVLSSPHPSMKDKPLAPRESFHSIIVGLSYRLVFAVSFVIRQHVSKILSHINYNLGSLGLNLLRLSPCYNIDFDVMKSRQNPLTVDRLVYMAYPYWYMFKAMFTGEMEAFSDFSLPKDLVSTPVLYMYGKNKRMMFHDQCGLKVLEREAEREGRKSSAIGLEGAGHWLYLQEPDICLEEVVKFVTDA